MEKKRVDLQNSSLMRAFLIGVLFFGISCSTEQISDTDLKNPDSKNQSQNLSSGESTSNATNNNSNSQIQTDASVPEGPLYLASNGITVKAGTLASIGDRIEFQGNEYLVVDNNTLRDIVKNDREILTYLVTSYVTDMSYLFEGRQSLTPNIGGWDTSSVTDMSYLFYRASIYNGDISKWDTSKVRDMSYMFSEAIEYNRDLSSWDTEKVNQMEGMFYGASQYSKDLSSWCVPLISQAPKDFSRASKLSANQLPKWGSCPNS